MVEDKLNLYHYNVLVKDVAVGHSVYEGYIVAHSDCVLTNSSRDAVPQAIYTFIPIDKVKQITKFGFQLVQNDVSIDSLTLERLVEQVKNKSK